MLSEGWTSFDSSIHVVGAVQDIQRQYMQIEPKNNLSIINQNTVLLQKLPEYLSKHLQVYENLHKDIDPYDQHSISHFRNMQENNESYTKQLINASTEFVGILSQLKNNFIKLSESQGKEPQSQPRVWNPPSSNISNFDVFVSEHSEQSGYESLKQACQPAITDQDFQKFLE